MFAFLAATQPVLAQPQPAETIVVSTCTGQLIVLETPGQPSGLALGIVDSNTPAHNAIITVQDDQKPVAIVADGNGSMQVTVPSHWRETVIAMTARPFVIVAMLRYHSDGSNNVLEDFRLTQHFGRKPQCLDPVK